MYVLFLFLLSMYELPEIYKVIITHTQPQKKIISLKTSQLTVLIKL